MWFVSSGETKRREPHRCRLPHRRSEVNQHPPTESSGATCALDLRSKDRKFVFQPCSHPVAFHLAFELSYRSFVAGSVCSSSFLSDGEISLNSRFMVALSGWKNMSDVFILEVRGQGAWMSVVSISNLALKSQIVIRNVSYLISYVIKATQFLLDLYYLVNCSALKAKPLFVLRD